MLAQKVSNGRETNNCAQKGGLIILPRTADYVERKCAWKKGKLSINHKKIHVGFFRVNHINNTRYESEIYCQDVFFSFVLLAHGSPIYLVVSFRCSCVIFSHVSSDGIRPVVCWMSLTSVQSATLYAADYFCQLNKKR